MHVGLGFVVDLLSVLPGLLYQIDRPGSRISLGSVQGLLVLGCFEFVQPGDSAAG